MFPCGMLSTKFNRKQNYTVKLSLIDRNNSNKKSPGTFEVFSFSHVYNTILTMLGIFSKHSRISFKYRTKLNILNKCCPSYCKIVETGETDDKCYNLLKYSCNACYHDFFSSPI